MGQQPSKEYDSNEVIVSIVRAGVAREINRGRPGTFLRANPESPIFETKAGSSGQTIFYKMNDPRMNLALIMDQTSDDNQIMSDIANSGESFDLQVSVLGTDTVISAITCKALNFPEQEFSQEPGEREWPIMAGCYVQNVAGGKFA